MAQDAAEARFRPFFHHSNDRLMTFLKTQLQNTQLIDTINVFIGLIQNAATNTDDFYIVILKLNELNNQLVLERTVSITNKTNYELIGDDLLKLTSVKSTTILNKECLLVEIEDSHVDDYDSLYFRITPGESTQKFVGTLVDVIERLQKAITKLDNTEIRFNEDHFNSSQFNQVFKSNQIYRTNSRFYDNSLGSESSSNFRIDNKLSEMQHRSQLLRDERQDEFVKWHKLRVFIGTWNVNGQLLKNENQMCQFFLGCDPSPPDIYAIGFQELDLSKEAYLFNDPNGKEAHWVGLCSQSLHKGAIYEKLDCVRLIGMMLIIFVKKDLMKHISDLDCCTVGTGLLGKMGNKGGVGIRFNFQDTNVCFINCHLAAHQEQVERRNADYREIIARMKFLKTGFEIENHEQIYWFGDMNYRINELNVQEIKIALDKKQFDYIQKKDQLVIERNKSKIFLDYQEGPINHMPTYKYNPGTDEWDSSEKERAPAWCDRILWKADSIAKPKDCQLIKQIIYRSHPGLKTSDHKPVSALFESFFKKIDKEKEKEVIDEIMKKLDKEENDYLPQVEIEKTDIDFGIVTFRDTPLANLRLKNIGKNSVEFGFQTKPSDRQFCRPWLQVTPSSARIGVGQSVNITFELNFDVDALIISRLNYGIEKLLDTLVLRLLGGRDIFITVTGTYKPTSFGCSLDTLVQIRRPISELIPEEMKIKFGSQIEPILNVSRYSNNFQSFNLSTKPLLIDFKESIEPNSNSTNLLPIPKELFLLVDYVAKNGLLRQDLFELSGSEDQDFIRIRSACDSAKFDLLLNIPPGSVMEAILLFLDYLPSPVIPDRFYNDAIKFCKNRHEVKQIINEMPLCHRKTFEFIIYFLRELLKFSDINRLTPHFLAQKFGPVLLRSPPQTDKSQDFSSNNESIMDQSLFSLTPQQMFLYNFLE